MSIRQTFSLCFGVAVLGIIGSVVFFALDVTATTVVPRGLAFAAVAVLPICVYSWAVSRAIKNHVADVSESSIDNVYYLGFLITLITLLASVMTYSIIGYGGAQDAQATVKFIGLQFGLSLIATAVALWLRVLLVQQFDGKRTNQEPDLVLDDNLFKLEEASRRLTTVLGQASSHFEDSLGQASSRFAESLNTSNAKVTQQTASIVEETRDRLKEFVQAASAEVSSAQRTMAETAVAGVQTMSANNAALFAQTRDVIEEARTSLRDFVKAATLEPSSTALAKAVADVTASLTKASQDLGGLFKSLEGLQRGSAAAVGDLDALSAGVRRASESTKAMSDALGRISASSAAIDLDSVRAGLAQVGDRLQSLGASATSAEQRYVAASETAIGSMRSKTEDLTEATRRLSDAFVAVANELTQSTTIISDALK